MTPQLSTECRKVFKNSRKTVHECHGVITWPTPSSPSLLVVTYWCVQLLTFVRGDLIQFSMNPLPPGPLGQRIDHLAASVGFPLGRIFVYEGTIRLLYNFWQNKEPVNLMLIVDWARAMMDQFSYHGPNGSQWSGMSLYQTPRPNHSSAFSCWISQCSAST